MHRIELPRWLWGAFALHVVLRLLAIALTQEGISLNPDEASNYRIAEYAEQGLGYVAPDLVNGGYRQAAFHNGNTVLLYQLLQRSGLSAGAYVLLHIGLNLVLVGLSLIAWMRLLQGLGLDARRVRVGCYLYALYPTFVYFIGAVQAYENLAVPLLVIAMWALHRLVTTGWAWRWALALALAFGVSVFFRPQVLLVFVWMGGAAGLWVLLQARQRMPSLAAAGALALLAVSLACSPAAIKFHAQFGVWGLSTQPGFELLQGHNPLARGSWFGAWHSPQSPYYQMLRRDIPTFDSLDQLAQSQACQRLALQHMRTQPTAELELLLRKTLIYFWPAEYESSLPGQGAFNPLRMVVHLAAAVGLWLLVFHSVRLPQAAPLWLVVAWAAAPLIISYVFFVGYRWRAYGDPALMVLALVAWQAIAAWRQRPASPAQNTT